MYKALVQILIGLAIIVFAAVFPGLPVMVHVVLYFVGAWVTVAGLRDL